MVSLLPSEQLGVMQDFEGPAEVRIFVPECIEAVGAVRHDLPDPLAPECLHVVFGEGLEQVLMPQSPSRIPRASLLRPEDRERHRGLLQHPHDGPADPFRPVVE